MYLFVQKSQKLGNEEGFKIFTKSLTKATVFEIFEIFLPRIIARKITFRMTYNNLVLFLKVMESFEKNQPTSTKVRSQSALFAARCHGRNIKVALVALHIVITAQSKDVLL